MTTNRESNQRRSFAARREKTSDPGFAVGVVAIGRNEGERLDKCIRSVIQSHNIVVYVDSGSTDNSPALARGLGADVVILDMHFAFTAARARNVGFRRLREIMPDLTYVQFVDGDCEIVADWIDNACKFLDEKTDTAIACGRRKERYPTRSIYNQLCDFEWDTPVGETKACGGDAMIRAKAFEEVDGYRDELIAGEEPELCVRLREAGWKIWRLDAEMTKHDAAMFHFGQWWRRHVRSGYAFAQGAYIHGLGRERFWVWEMARAVIWSIGIPAFSFVAFAAFGPWGSLPLVLYPLQFVRRTLKQTGNFPFRCQLAAFEILVRFPESLGAFRFLRDWLLGLPSRLIEYK